MQIAILIPAAGASSRMRGRDKLLEEIGAEPLLRRQVRRAVATGWPVVVCLRRGAPARVAALEGLGVQPVFVAQPERGMAATLREGMEKIGDNCEAVMVVPADMPDLETSHFQKVARHFEGKTSSVVRAVSTRGTPGHPVVFPRRLFEALRQLPDGEGARAVLQGEVVELCPLPGAVAITDLDSPEDWARWRAAQMG